MKFGALTLLILLAFTSACSVQTLDDTKGVAWEYFSYYYDIVAGPVLDSIPLNNLLYIADEAGNIIAINKISGTLNWIRTLSNEQILSLYSSENYLYITAVSNGTAHLVKYDNLSYWKSELTLPFVPLKNTLGEYVQFSSGQNSLILNSSNKIIKINLDSMTITRSADLTVQISDIVDVQGEDTGFDGLYDYYYAIGHLGKVVQLDSTFGNPQPLDLDISGNSKYKGASILKSGFLYVGTSTGVYKVETTTIFPGTSNNKKDSSIVCGYGKMAWYDNQLFATSSEVSAYGLVKYNTLTGLTESWFYSSWSPVTHSPAILDLNNNVAAFIDDYANIYVIKNGDLDYTRVFDLNLQGTTPVDRMDIPMDESSYIYIPFVNKIVAYSLEWASRQQPTF